MPASKSETKLNFFKKSEVRVNKVIETLTKEVPGQISKVKFGLVNPTGNTV